MKKWLGVLGMSLLMAQSTWAAVCTVNNGLIVPPNADIQLNGVAGVPGLVIGVGEPDCKIAPVPAGCNKNQGVAYVNGVATALPGNTAQLNAVSVASTTYAVAVGDNKNGMPVALVQFNGTTWTAMPITGTAPVADANGVKTYGPNQTYVVGDGGIYFFNGTTWTRQLSIGSVPNLNGQNAGKFEAIWGDATYVYALADNGALYQKVIATPPTVWTRMTATYPAGSNRADFQAITGDAAGNVYVAGQDNNNKGFVYQYNPVSNIWTSLISQTNMDLNGIAINPVNGAITAVGDNGATLTSGPNGAAPWTAVPEVNNTNDINGVYIAPNGTTYMSGQTAVGCTPTTAGPHHIEIQHTGSGLTCSPSTITIRACADATCATLYTGGGLTVTPTPAGAAIVIGATGTATTTVQQSTAGVATLGATANPTAAAATTCLNTLTNTASCAMTFSNAGFVVTVPNHTSCTAATATIEAVQTGGTGRCVPAYQNVTQPVNLSFSYTSPVTGTQSINVLSGSDLTTVTTTATQHQLPFDVNGTATLGLSYADAGQLTLTASGTAPTGAAMTGSGVFIAAPASFVFSGIPAAPLTAGSPFNVTLTAMNACATPAATPNFNGTVTLTSANPQPALGNATAISSAASTFTAGASSTNLTWNEVGTIDLSASMSSYLTWTLPAAVTGSQASVGRFHPAYFVTTVTPACGTFSYAGSVAPAKAGQPFSVTATAYSASGNITKNYAGAANAYLTTLSNAGDSTGFAGNTIAAADFLNGVGSASAVTYAVATPETAPVSLTLRATNTDSVSSAGHDAATQIRSGRARLTNAYGSQLLDLSLPFTAQYYNGSKWDLNAADGCTVATIGALTLQPSATPVAKSFNSPFKSGQGGLNLVKPMANGVVTVSPTVDIWMHYGWVGGALSGPTAQATFGIYKGANEFIYLREAY
ncbi:MAG: hypothetical protein C0406_03915 [Sideroxydans sp.]|nr:hypothetical protein [Sideroxydans sp.]